MQTIKNTPYITVLEQIKDWPVDEQLALVQDIVHTLRLELVKMDHQIGKLGHRTGASGDRQARADGRNSPTVVIGSKGE